MKLLFYIRDIRGGLGERELFRTLIRHTAEAWPESAAKNVSLIPEYGRFDDLMCLMGTSAQSEAVKVIRRQLEEDLRALKKREQGEVQAHISLLAKWMPSINASSKRTRRQAGILAKALGMKEPEYRKTLAGLRSQISLSECYLTRGSVDKIRYEAVPAGAMLKYRRAFAEKDAERFSGFLEQVQVHKQKMHADTLYPYEIIRPFIDEQNYGLKAAVRGEAVLQALWDSRKAEAVGENAISVIDTSGSMYCGGEGVLKPALIAQALGLYHAQHSEGIFHNTFITFSSRPELVEIKGETLKKQLGSIQSADWGFSTNLEAVFELILNAAVKAEASQEEMPSVLYIISDMEFNQAVKNPDRTVYENAKEMFEESGYQMPAVVFHNVNSWKMQAPVTAHTKGTALVSGAGTNSFACKFDGNVTPMGHMLRVINSSRYAAVHA